MIARYRWRWAGVFLVGLSLAWGMEIVIGEDDQPPALKRLSAALLADYRTALEALDGDQGKALDKDRAILMYHVALETADYAAMGEAVDMLEALVEARPEEVEPLAYLGSALILRARDYPWQGLYQIIPGPGFVRLYYVAAGTGRLNEAIAKDGRNPIARLVRGITFTRMPRLFGNYGTGLEDLATLKGWVERPDADSVYSALLKDRAFTAQVHFHLAEAYWLDGEVDKARSLFLEAEELAPPGSPVVAAAREMAR